MKYLRTPRERFLNLPDYIFEENYIQLSGYSDLRMHYVDIGSQNAQNTFLCLHGQPTWSYLYRKMIPVFAAAGARVIAPDLFGFGKSDKPVEDEVYTYDFHRQSLIQLISQLNLQSITLVCQDWGGLLGLTIPMEMPYRFKRLIVMNTMLMTGTFDLGPGFYAWKNFNSEHPDLDICRLMKKSVPQLSDSEAKAYAAPFPDLSYKSGVRRFPNLVATTSTSPGASLSQKAKSFWREEWNGRAFMAIGMRDTVIPPASMYGLQKIIKNCSTPMVLENAGHFVQEEGMKVAEESLRYFESSQ